MLRNAYSPADRAALIDRIVAAARKPMPEIVARREVLGTDGKWYRGGLPRNVGLVTGESRIYGYVAVDKDGIGQGRVGATAVEVSDRIAAYYASTEADFKVALEAMPDARLKSQRAYWLKEGDDAS